MRGMTEVASAADRRRDEDRLALLAVSLIACGGGSQGGPDAGIVAPSILRPGSRLLVGRDGVLRWYLDGDILLLSDRGQTLGTVPVESTSHGVGFVHLWQPEEGEGVLLAGSSWVPDEPRRFACLASSGDTCLRLAIAFQSIDADGALDTAFGDGGTTITDLPRRTAPRTRPIAPASRARPAG